MKTRANPTGYGATRGWLWALCAACSLVIGVGSVWAAAPAVAGDAVVAEADSAGPQSLSLSTPIPALPSAVNPNAPTGAGCPVTALPNDNSTSGNERAPNLRNRFGRSVYLITATELAAAGITGGTGLSGIGWSFQTAPGLSGSNNLTVYLQNTADATNLKSTTWTTAITGMTVVHSAATTIPNVTGPFDITFSGGSAFTYTGGGLYVAFDAQYPVGTLSLTTVVWCNATGLVNGLLGAQGAAAPATLAASSFRPETRLASSVATILNDASVDFVISLGSLAQPLVGPQTVQAVITNMGANALTDLPVTFDLTGAETFTNGQVVSSLAACGGQATVTFSPFTPSAIGGDTVTITVPADDVAGNNSKSRPLDETFNLYSYKHPGTTATGGVGVNLNTADFVAKFTTTTAAEVFAINLEFLVVGATTYRVAIYPDSGSGTPGLVPLYEDAADRTVAVTGPVTITLPSPVPVGPGTFFAGVQQTNTTNAGLSYDNEIPIRAGAFYLAIPHPATAWFDFAPGNNFKLNIGVTLVQCSGAAECNDNNACTDDACTSSVCVHANNTNACDDGTACTANDTCANGVCMGEAPPACDDGNACTANICNPGTGQCENPAIVCNDNNTCTDDSCSPATGCAFAPNDNNTCADNNLCTQTDVCQNAVCVGQNPVVCIPDANVCTTEACDPATGCASTNNTNACDDGNVCTTGDTCGPALAENFDSLTAPALPAVWTTAVTGTGNAWTTVSTSSDTAPNSAFGFDGALVADEVLVSPPIAISSASATLTFRNRYTLESTFDGGVLEIDIAGGGFTDIEVAGGSFSSGGYTGIISTAWGNPLGGRSAWTGASTGYPAYVTTIVNLPPAAAGQTIELRWRVGTDSSVGDLGQNIDSIVLLDGSAYTCNPGTAVSCDDSTACTADSCSPATGCVFAPITAPPETQNVRVAADKVTYTWSAAEFATRYDVVRGSLAALPVGPGGGDEVCFDDLAGTTLGDPTVPVPETGFWYLSRGENSCGNGTYGTQGVNGGPGAPRITTTCM